MVTGSQEQLDDLVEEGLRFEPAAAIIPRRCSADTELGGMQIKKGERALFAMAAANRDPQVFDDPDTFRPGRKQRHLSFGNGVHVCLGQHFARAELAVGLRMLFERFPNMQLAEGPVVYEGGLIRGPERLQVVL